MTTRTTRTSARQKDQLAKDRLRQQQQRRNILLGVAAVVLVVLVIIILSSVLKNNEPVVAIIPITPVARTQTQGLSIGDPNAPVKMDVYEDFQCPMCKAFSEQIEPAVVGTYVDSGKVFLTFHQFPFIDSLDTTGKSSESHQAANASMCANEQGRFWDYRDMLFTNWAGENAGSFSNTRLVAFAKSLNLDMEQFNNCFNGFKYRDQIEQDVRAGNLLGLTGTPAIFINGTQVKPGYVPSFAEIALAVEAALPKK